MFNSGGLSLKVDYVDGRIGCKCCIRFSGTAIICLQFDQDLLFYYKQIYQSNNSLIRKLAKYIYIYISYTGMSFGLLAEN